MDVIVKIRPCNESGSRYMAESSTKVRNIQLSKFIDTAKRKKLDQRIKMKGMIVAAVFLSICSPRFHLQIMVKPMHEK